ncbi:MAG: Trk system potassium transporter TrkA [Clostridia bacterium]|nr:Trk system potassium transporter TrkA [Clostridia bacterium]
MNIIIAGCGKVGQKLAEKISCEEDNNITVIDTRHALVKQTTDAYDVMGVVGNCTGMQTLEEAGIDSADILIAVTGSDEINLLCCLIAKKMGHCQTIARVSKPEYINEIQLIKEDLGLAMLINPKLIAAREIARILRFPSAVHIDTFVKGRVEILKFKVPQGSVLNNYRIADISSDFNCDVLVCGVERGNEVYIPDGSFVIQEGDFVSIIAAPSRGSEFFKNIGIKTNRVKDTIIVGGGDTAYYLAKRLSETGIKIKIIEKDPARSDELCQILPKVSVVNADGTDNKVLLEEGVKRTESVVSLINIDEENILLSLFAKSQNENAKIITQINRMAYENVISKLDLDTIIYPLDATADSIVKFVRAKKNSFGSNIETMHHILDGKAEALEFRVLGESEIVGQTLSELNIKKNVLVACINRNGTIIIPRGHDKIMVGDTVIIVTTISGLDDIGDILE